MKIEHTTHDDARNGANSNSRREILKLRSATKKVRDYFMIKSQRQYTGEKKTFAQATVAKQVSPTIVTLPAKDQARRHQQLTMKSSTVHETSAGLAPQSRLRRKTGVEDMMEGIKNKIPENLRKRREGRGDMENLYPSTHGRVDALEQKHPEMYRPRFSPSNKHPFSAPEASIPHQRSRTALTSNNLTECIEISADLLDSTRRELTKGFGKKFKPPFEHLSYHSFSHEREPSPSSSSKSSSFFCTGENGRGGPKGPAQVLSQREEKNSRRRLSGEGTDPWKNPAPTNCRLCKKAGVRGIRGLCEECEKDFMRPTTYLYDPPFSYDENMPPTPPLKDASILMLNHTQCKPNQDEIEKEAKSRIEVRWSSASSRPTVAEPTPQRQSSQRALFIDTEADDDERFSRWQSDALQVEIDKTRGLFERWSACHADNGHDSVSSSAPSDQKGKERAGDRGSRFYGYWDDVLVSYGGAKSVKERTP
ncbi:hypothetical protein BP6252_10498 [Coleophoma cylindrospora]|uniref:Uncharacterized protein n=1 Tax=Coleophoma cylindrospora TaxID=1849047 RepID=A0A3D8QSU0_9HELO|nr:hypothetical protein BP6252_10498 [Coleophoma cylindrospora]